MTTHEKDPLRSRYDVRTKWLLGKGADGGVLRGIQKSTGVFRALKFQSRTAWSADKELEVLRAMSHPNVASLIEWFEPSSDGKRPQRVLVFARVAPCRYGCQVVPHYHLSICSGAHAVYLITIGCKGGWEKGRALRRNILAQSFTQNRQTYTCFLSIPGVMFPVCRFF